MRLKPSRAACCPERWACRSTPFLVAADAPASAPPPKEENTSAHLNAAFAKSYGEIQVISDATTETYADHMETAPAPHQYDTGKTPSRHEAGKEGQRQKEEGRMHKAERNCQFGSASKSETYRGNAVAGRLPLELVSCFETGPAVETPWAWCGKVHTTTRNSPYAWNVP